MSDVCWPDIHLGCLRSSYQEEGSSSHLEDALEVFECTQCGSLAIEKMNTGRFMFYRPENRKYEALLDTEIEN